MSVLVLDGSERLASFPRLVVLERDDGRWGACVLIAAGRRQWLPQDHARQDDAKRACLAAARTALPRRWQAAIASAVEALGVGDTGTDASRTRQGEPASIGARHTRHA